MIKGFACGVFDLFHAGHVMMLQDCSKNCDHLTVALNKAENIDEQINPNKKPPVYSFEERKMILEACKYVDEVVEYNTEEELTKIMETGNFHIRFLGDDYKGKPITAGDAIKKIYYLDRSHGLSTSKFKEKLYGFKQ